jgi:peptidoglycan/LPS O-acetylase OafA/YrhL
VGTLPSKQDPSGRAQNCFDFLRLFAALAVVVQHGVEHLQTRWLWVGPEGGWWFRDGVALFFVMSGMLVYRSCARCYETGRPLRHYFLNRFLRVAPLIYLYAIVTPIFLVAIGALALHALASKGMLLWQAGNLALIPVVHPHELRHFGVGVVNGSLWTIPAEVSFYLLCPLLYRIERRFGLRGLTAATIALALVGTVQRWACETYFPESTITKALTITFLPYFLFFGLGVLASRFWQRLPQSLGLAVGCAVFYLLVRNSVFHLDRLGPGPAWRLVWGVPMAYAFIYLGSYGPRFLAELPRKIGDLSYGVYVWHMVVINSFLYFGVRERLAGAPASAAITAVGAATVALALCSWWFVERNALKLKPFSTRQPETAVAVSPSVA